MTKNKLEYKLKNAKKFQRILKKRIKELDNSLKDKYDSYIKGHRDGISFSLIRLEEFLEEEAKKK